MMQNQENVYFSCLYKRCKGYWLWDLVAKKNIINNDFMFDVAYMLKKDKLELPIENQERIVAMELDNQKL